VVSQPAVSAPQLTLHRDERGMLSFASLFAVLGMVVGFALVANIGKTVGTKLETQNAADAAASGASTEMARGMNAVTAANHIIGELQALIVIHHALGGDELDGLKSPQRTPSDLRASLDLSHNVARAVSTGSAPAPIGYNQLRQEPQAGAAIWDSQIELKKIMTWAYAAHASGAILTQLKWIPYVGQVLYAIGQTIVTAAMVFEGKALQEWLTLELVRGIATITMPVKKLLQWAVVPGLYLYTCAVAGAVPGVSLPLPIPGVAASKAEDAAAELGRNHAAEATLFPGLKTNTSIPVLALPLTPEPRTLRHPERSQLVRASTPWIQRWRIKWMEFGESALLMSRFKCHYKKWTDHFTLELAKRAKQQTLVNLLVIRELDIDGRDKTHEPWAEPDGSGSATADRLFAVIGFARRPPPGIAALGYFRQPNPDGFVAFAQGMVYNANPHKQGANRPGWQAVAGWDTLNWDSEVPEYPGPNPKGETCPIPRVPEPRVKLNWRAKLVPTTRLPASVLWQRGELGEVMRRTPVVLPGPSNTH